LRLSFRAGEAGAYFFRRVRAPGPPS